ncbi:alanine racemase [Lysinibacillus sp. 2017]|uniref:alanine racemase n=1 Tax=unclassified Lysinibacillus TaxID=2636778 RepID=UPI000D526342|nr:MULTISPECIES: alanine racemase [unclassified Lysinibacillus]AWE08184.1 alanine racemase [Lysinibacillus sp. 2017]TGN36312.1 alanine racemase [Lysinibacillus sp. S2017]
MLEWKMTEAFTFPSYLGNVTGATLTVKPNWQQEELEDSIVLKGVYVIKGNVQFDFIPIEDEKAIEGTFIEHLDIEQDQAYFEYALPFSIDFPRDDVEKITMRVEDQAASFEKGTNCTCTWQVCCEVEKKAAVIVEKKEAVIVEKQEAPVVEKKVEEEIVQQPIELEVKQLAVEEVDLEYVKSFVVEGKETTTEEVDFFEQLAEAYSVVQVQLKNGNK